MGVKILRKPTDLDWQGWVKDIHINITAKTVAISEDKPLSAQIFLGPKDEAQKTYLEELIQSKKLKVALGPNLCLLDKTGQVCIEEMRWWLPSQLETLDKEDGGPYTQNIKLKDKYILVNEGEQDEQLVAVGGFKVTYFVEVYSEEVISYGEQIVDAILKDFNTNDVEYVKKKF